MATGTPSRDTTRTAVAILAVAGFVLVAAVLPVLGGEAPGSSLLPESVDRDLTRDGDGGALERALGGAGAGTGGQAGATGSQGGAGGGTVDDDLVEGLFSSLEDGGGAPPAGEGQDDSSGGGEGAGRFGALNPGDRTGVGSSDSPVSESTRNRSATPHFVVRSSHPGYWRTGAYETYTGSDWTVDERPEPGDWPRRPSTAPTARETVVQRYRLLRPATALPGVYEPTAVDGDVADRLEITDQGALRAPSTLPANTTYTVESRAPPRSPDRLRAAGRDYPPSIERTYTELPADTPDRLERFTDDLTADTDTPYESALAIERWLEANKGYSLQASHEGANVADQFVFEMDQGYCEYFATSMAVMLRTQDIPARYVVGYSTGEPIGNGSYLVRGMNAHAWVEVYVPETGWVRFDPTPGQSRLAGESETLARAIEEGDAESTARRFFEESADGDGGDPTARGSDDDATDGDAPDVTDVTDRYNHTEEGSPAETFDPSGGPSYGITLEDDPVPGSTVSVAVTRNGEPATGVVVTFDGDPIGTTDASGIVVGEVPYTARLVVDVEAGTAGGAGGGVGLLRSVAVPDVAGDSVADGPTVATRRGVTDNETNTSRTFDVPTTIAVTVDGDTAPTEAVTVGATIRDSPVAGATVTLDGDAVAETDDSGEATVTLPAAERTTLVVRRGDAVGNRTLSLANVSVETSGFALPGLSVTVTVTDDGDPVEGATVSVGDRTVETGADGTASVSLPVATGATVTVETPYGISKSEPVHYRFLTAGAVALLVLLVLAGAVVARRRAAAAGISVPEQLVVAVRWLGAAFVAGLVGLALRVEHLSARVPVLAGRLLARLRAVVGEVVAAVRAVDVRRLLAVVPGPRTVLAWLVGWLGGATASLGSAAPFGDATGEDSPTGPSDSSQAATDLDPRERIRVAWRAFRARLPVSDPRSKTPAELARTGLDAEFPADAVRTLRDAIQAVEYGQRDPSSYVTDVEAAAHSLATHDEPESVADGAGGPLDDEGDGS
jgi:transglutaminase-like putative cysteine protease